MRQTIAKYQKVLLLDRFIITIKHVPDLDAASMECEFRYPYLDVTIRYSDKAIKRWKNKEDITNQVIHELWHIVTDPFYAKAVSRHVGKSDLEEEREHLVDTLTSITIKSLTHPVT